jgi:hypothetical protein
MKPAAKKGCPTSPPSAKKRRETSGTPADSKRRFRHRKRDSLLASALTRSAARLISEGPSAPDRRQNARKASAGFRGFCRRSPVESDAPSSPGVRSLSRRRFLVRQQRSEAIEKAGCASRQRTAARQSSNQRAAEGMQDFRLGLEDQLQRARPKPKFRLSLTVRASAPSRSTSPTLTRR